MAPASAGRITVPTSILSQMPAANGTTPDSMGTVGVQHTPGPQSIVKLDAPLVGGGKLEAGYFLFAFGSMKTAGYK